MLGDDVRAADLAGLSVPLAGSLEQTSDPRLPYRMIDPADVPVEAVSAFFGDLQAAGRSEATARSYGMDLLRWFRFLWAIQVPASGDADGGPGLLPLSNTVADHLQIRALPPAQRRGRMGLTVFPRPGEHHPAAACRLIAASPKPHLKHKRVLALVKACRYR